jgi:hypothetical protein
MEKPTNEIWLQFAWVNSKGNVNKTPLKIPFHQELETDQEIPVSILGQTYNFFCVREEIETNHDGTVDKIFVIATNHQ